MGRISETAIEWMLIALVIVGLVAVFAVPSCRAEVELSIGPVWANAQASPYDLDLRTKTWIPEAHIRCYAPYVWAEMIVRSPAKFSGTFTIPDEITWDNVKFKKSSDGGEITYDGQVTNSRVKVGFYPLPWLMPYVTAMSRTSDWTFTQTDKQNKVVTLRCFKPTTGVGGGVRLTAPLTPAVLAYGDGRWDTVGFGFEGGVEWRLRQYFLSGFYRGERDNLLPASASMWGTQLGVRF